LSSFESDTFSCSAALSPGLRANVSSPTPITRLPLRATTHSALGASGVSWAMSFTAASPRFFSSCEPFFLAKPLSTSLA
jgi:hypothetical protein